VIEDINHRRHKSAREAEEGQRGRTENRFFEFEIKRERMIKREKKGTEKEVEESTS
jgi:hypothetical protein